MLILITYDVNTETAAGRTRLRKVAKQCVNYGTRVQNSVFECILDNTQMIKLKAILTDIIDEQTDSLRFYNLGNKHTTKVDHVGVSKGIKVEEPLIFCLAAGGKEVSNSLVRTRSKHEFTGGFAPENCTVRTVLDVCRAGWR